MYAILDFSLNLKSQYNKFMSGQVSTSINLEIIKLKKKTSF